MSTLSDEQLNAALEKGYVDMKESRTRSAAQVFAEIRKDYNL